MGKPQSSSEGAPEYVFDESSALSRRVKPYVFTYTMNCKGRWIGRRPAEIFAAEFKMNPASYYAEALADGRILVNGELCGDDLVLKNGDVLVHRAHRHEPPGGGSVEVDCSTRTKCHRDGVCECALGGADAKASRTRFRLLRRHADGTSTVECHPRTGRTHQIRLHLQWLGHPIANDPNYGGTLGYGESSYAGAPAPSPGVPVADAAGPGGPAKTSTPSYAGPGWAYETNLPAWATDGALPPEPEPEKRGCCVS
ncbi:pseudouridine synthase [Aureococcus anophagefferens]|nr:pseudouridine synthase [Aureococcus anophagefferens]